MASIETVPANLDWVKVQSGCLIKGAFESLRAGVEEDIKSYNAMLQLPPTHEIKISSEISTIFIAIRRSISYAQVEFSRRGNCVEIRQSEVVDHPASFSVTPIFSNLGRCRWKFDEEELEQWQVRRMALEKFLFPPQFVM
jgi:hypothetical protein